MARASRKLAISHLAQHAAQRLLGDGDTKLFENPLAKIDDPPAHDPMNRRDRSVLQDRRQRRAMLVIQPRRLPFSPAIDQPGGAMRVEPEHSVADNLQPHAADLRRLSTLGPVIDRRKSQQPSRLRPVLRTSRRRPKRAPVKIVPKPNCRRHRQPPSVRHGDSKFSRFGNPPPESASARTGIRRQGLQARAAGRLSDAAFNSVSSTEKCSALRSPFTSGRSSPESA